MVPQYQTKEMKFGYPSKLKTPVQAIHEKRMLIEIEKHREAEETEQKIIAALKRINTILTHP
jgi:hypothetical protein